MQRRRPVMLAILDGWGWREDPADNAVKQARTPNFDRLWASCPTALLRTSGKDVGLPHGPDGQFRGRPSQHRRRARRDAGPAADRRRDRERRDREAAGAARPDRVPQGQRRHLPPDGPGFAGRRAFASGSCGRPRQNSGRRRRADAGACLDRRPRYAAAIGRRRHRAACGSVAEVDPDRDGVRTLLCDGPRQALGARRQGLRGRWSTPTARGFPMPARSSRPPMRTRNSTSSSSRRSSATIAACATATACSASTSAPTACAKSSRAMLDPKFLGLRAQARGQDFAAPSA